MIPHWVDFKIAILTDSKCNSVEIQISYIIISIGITQAYEDETIDISLVNENALQKPEDIAKKLFKP